MTPEMEKAEREDAGWAWIAESHGATDGGEKFIRGWLARASECHSLTEEEAENIVEPHRTWWSAINYSFMPCETVVKLLMEHSQHKCGCEEEIAELKRQLDGATFVQKKWDEREEVIKAYKEALTEISRSATNHRGYMFDIAKEVLTRMESHKLPEVK